MAISIRTRFIAISVTITAIGLILFSNVIYEKAIGYKRQLEINAFHSLSDQLITQAQTYPNIEDIRHLLQVSIKARKHAASLYVILDGKQQSGKLYTNDTQAEPLFDRLINSINNAGNVNQGIFEKDNGTFFWLSYKLDNNLSLVTVYPLSPSSLSEVLDFFGTPLFISSFLLLWIMVWASIILSSLVTKLQNQKQTLNDQATDIKKSSEEALQANRAKSSFLANMSHEIRTPLTSIIGFAESCLDANQSMQERYQATRTIINSSNHLLHLINEILDISKIEAGKIEIENGPANLSELIHEINMFASVLAEEKRLKFTINSLFPLPSVITTDAFRLKQILLNLCSNAIKFTDRGHVELNISYQPQQGQLKFSVSDTGIGMTEEQLEKIFSPFQQADVSTSRKFGGTGLGLTLSKELTEMLGGSITVESTIKNGSCFSILIPAKNINANDLIYSSNYSTINNNDKFSESDQLPHYSGRILVAEDNKDIQALINLLIKQVTDNFVIVENGFQALEQACKSQFDLILMDIQMPIMSGIEAYQQIRKKGISTPIVAMTANVMKRDRDECMAVGFDGFLSKPINKTDFYTIIGKYLTESKAPAAEGKPLTSDILKEEPQIIDLIDIFIERLPEMLNTINNAVSNKDWESLSSKIHQLKGVGGSYGYPMLTKQAQKIEFSLTSQNYSQVNLLVKELGQLCKQIVAGKDNNHQLITPL